MPFPLVEQVKISEDIHKLQRIEYEYILNTMLVRFGDNQ